MESDGDKFDIVQIINDLKNNESAKYKYQIVGSLGKGKFSTVYKAKCQDAVLAVKKVQIFEMMDARSREKCLKEIKLLQSLQHPNIIRYVDSYIDNNELFIVLEFAEGGDLKGLIKRVISANRVFEESIIWSYIEQIASGLHHMHAKRIMHRDLKPANIMLTIDNKVKLGDLGLGRYFTSQTIEAFSKVGTPLYMSAEVLQGNGYTFSADIWSLGCVLYELCMLRSPFKSDKGVNLYDLFQKIKNGQYEPISDRYSPALSNLINSMINLVPEQRPTIEQILSYSEINNPFKKPRKVRKVKSLDPQEIQKEEVTEKSLTKKIDNHDLKLNLEDAKYHDVPVPDTKDSRKDKIEEKSKSIKQTSAIPVQTLVFDDQASKIITNPSKSDKHKTKSDKNSSLENLNKLRPDQSKDVKPNVVTESAPVESIVPDIIVKSNSRDLFFIEMDCIIDKLNLLDISQFYSRYNLPSTTSPYLLLEPFKNPILQQKYFLSLTSWLIDKCGIRPPEVNADVNGTISNIIVALSKLKILIDFSPSKLRTGFGDEVCSIVTQLVCLAIKRMKFGVPIHVSSESNENCGVVPEILEVQNFSDELEVSKLEFIDESKIMEIETEKINPSLWISEYNRLSDAKAFTARKCTSTTWKVHTDRVVKELPVYSDILKLASPMINSFSNELKQEISLIRSIENNIKAGFSADEFVISKQNLANVNLKYSEELENVRNLQNELDSVSTKYEELEEKRVELMEANNATLSNNILLSKQRIAADIGNMNLRIGLLQHELLSNQLVISLVSKN